MSASAPAVNPGLPAVRPSARATWLVCRAALLTALLLGEIVLLSVRFDAQSLYDLDAGWAVAMRQTPRLARLGLAMLRVRMPHVVGVGIANRG